MINDAESTTRESKRENMNPTASSVVGAAHLVVPDDCDVCWRAAGAAVVGDVVVFGTGDPAGGEEERVELHAERLPSHVLDRQLAADGDRSRQKCIICKVFLHCGDIFTK